MSHAPLNASWDQLWPATRIPQVFSRWSNLLQGPLCIFLPCGNLADDLSHQVSPQISGYGPLIKIGKSAPFVNAWPPRCPCHCHICICSPVISWRTNNTFHIQGMTWQITIWFLMNKQTQLDPCCHICITNVVVLRILPYALHWTR